MSLLQSHTIILLLATLPSPLNLRPYLYLSYLDKSYQQQVTLLYMYTLMYHA